MPHNNIIALLSFYCFFCIYPFLLLYIPSFVETAGDPNAAGGGSVQGGLLSPEIGQQQQQHWELDGLLESVVAPRRIQSHTHDALTNAVVEHSKMPVFPIANVASGPSDQQQMGLVNHFEGSWQEQYHPQHQHKNQQQQMVSSSDFPQIESAGAGQQYWQQESYDSLLQQPAATYYSQPNSLGIIHQQQQEEIMDPVRSQIQLSNGMLLPQAELRQSQFQAPELHHPQQHQYNSLLQPSQSLSFEPATQSHQIPRQLSTATNTVNTTRKQEHLLHQWAEGRGGEGGELQGIHQQSYPQLNIPQQQTKNPHHQNHPQPQEQQQQRPFQLLKLSDAGKRQIQQESVVQRWKTQMQPPLQIHLPFEDPQQTSHEQAHEEPQQQHHKVPQQSRYEDLQQQPYKETQSLTFEPTHKELQEQMQLLPPDSSQEQLQQQAHELPHGQPQQQQGTRQMFNSNQTHNFVLPQNVVGKYNLQPQEPFIPSLQLTDASVRQIQQNYNQQEGQGQVEPLGIVSSDIHNKSSQHEQPCEQARQQPHDQPEQQSHEQAQQQPYDQQGKKDHEILKGWEELKNQFIKHSERMQSRAKAQLEINVGGKRQQPHEQAEHDGGVNSLWQSETHLVEQMAPQLPRQLSQQSPLSIQQQQQQQGVVLNHERALSHLLPQSDGMLPPPPQVQQAHSQQLPQYHLAQQQQQLQLQSNPHLLQPMHQPEQWYPHYHQSLSNQQASISQESILQSIPHAQSRANLLEGRNVNSAIDVEKIDENNSSKGKRKISEVISSQSSSSTSDVWKEKRKKLMHDGIASGYSISPQNLSASETSKLSMSPFAQQPKMMQEVSGNRILRVHVSTDLDIEEFRVTVTRGKDENNNLLLGKNKKTHGKCVEFELSPGWKIKERDVLTVRVTSVGGIKNRIKTKDFFFSETNLDIQFPYTDRGKITFLPKEHESR